MFDSEDESVGRQRVLDGKPFAKEFRVPCYFDGVTGRSERTHSFAQRRCSSYRNGRLADDDRRLG
ncbi:hypothetical protein IM25_02650 [Rhodococcus sp. p52]|nr:hypothetical protein IM25_02650 [Rhodococcus sp. p52]